MTRPARTWLHPALTLGVMVMAADPLAAAERGADCVRSLFCLLPHSRLPRRRGPGSPAPLVRSALPKACHCVTPCPSSIEARAIWSARDAGTSSAEADCSPFLHRKAFSSRNSRRATRCNGWAAFPISMQMASTTYGANASEATKSCRNLHPAKQGRKWSLPRRPPRGSRSRRPDRPSFVTTRLQVLVDL